MNMDSNRCAITDSEDIIDDCYIEISFGYGSPRDLQTYNFGAVKHCIGEEILQYIAEKLACGKTLEEFRTDSFALERLSDDEEFDMKHPNQNDRTGVDD
jgi:hypothetical protein|tara:strand:+ start:246 stop:542 length:297 start_codon:yes stop_codon:yes gene_type:complete